VAATPLDSPCDGPENYPGDKKAILYKSLKERIGNKIWIKLISY
jgi:hypothetical protein